ncbi:MAG: O-antigen ligase family protein [Saprospiraceae bacterium]
MKSVADIESLSGAPKWYDADLPLWYAYFFIALCITVYLIYKSKPKYPFEIGALLFYLLTGNASRILTLDIGIIDIQPPRAIFLILSFFLVRKIFYGTEKVFPQSLWRMPWFMVFLYAYVIFLTVSQITHVGQIKPMKIVTNAIENVNFLVIIYALIIIIDKKTLELIAKAMIITAIFSCIISILQIGYHPLFMRLGDHRIAFGSLLRANGLFSAENYNSYFLIITMIWTLITVHKPILKWSLIGLFIVGVLITFHRMSYLIMSIIFAIYFLKLDKIRLDRVIILSLGGATCLLALFVFFQAEIMGSSFVQERMTDHVDGRKGYYTMVFDNIGDKPVFGFGGKKNDVYYQAMIRITGEMNRATGTTGGIHSGYFSTLFYYGIPACFFFTTFILLTIYYFGYMTRYHLFFAIPFIMAIIYCIGSFTNTFLFDRYLAILFAIHIGVGMGARHMMEFIPHPINEKKSVDSEDRTPARLEYEY